MKFKKATLNIPDINMTPMIDIVFQLIAFFMVITNFDNAKADERVKLPKDVLARPVEKANSKQLMVNMGFIRNKAGDITSPPIIFWPNGTNYTVDKIRGPFEVEAKYYKDTKTKMGDVTIIIRADAEFPTGLVQQVMKIAKELEFEKFSMKVTQDST